MARSPFSSTPDLSATELPRVSRPVSAGRSSVSTRLAHVRIEQTEVVADAGGDPVTRFAEHRVAADRGIETQARHRQLATDHEG